MPPGVAGLDRQEYRLLEAQGHQLLQDRVNRGLRAELLVQALRDVGALDVDDVNASCLREESELQHGATYPGAALPFGQEQ